jgi:hypothetical protein
MLASSNIIDHLAEEDEEKLIKVQTRTLNYLINELIDDRLEELKRFEFVRISGQIMNIYAKQVKFVCFKCSSDDPIQSESSCLFDRTFFPDLTKKYFFSKLSSRANIFNIVF